MTVAKFKSSLKKFDDLERWAWGALVAGNLFFAHRFVTKLDETTELVAVYGTANQVQVAETRVEINSLKGDIKRLDSLIREIARGAGNKHRLEDAAYSHPTHMLRFPRLLHACY